VVAGTEVGVRYAIGGDARLAFKVFAGGLDDIVSVSSWITNQDFVGPGDVLIERLMSFASVVLYDQRGRSVM
jgi:hypothetical protein